MKILFTSLFACLFLYGCQNQNIPEIRFLKNKSIDTIPFDYSETGHIRIKASIDTNTYDFLLDTGASFSFINKDIEIKGKHVDFDTGKSITNINGDSYLALSGTIIQKLNIGNIKINNFGYYNYQLNQKKLSGILGNNILKGLVCKIDFSRSELHFSKNIENFDLTGYRVLPMPFYNGGPHLNVNIGGKSFSMLIDTGNSENFLSFNNKERVFFNNDQHKIYNWKFLKQASILYTMWSEEQEKIDSLGILIADVDISDYELSSQFIRFNNQPDRQIGLNFLRLFGKVILDYPNSKIYLAKPTNKMSITQLLDVAKYINSYGVIFSNDTINRVIAVSAVAESLGIKLNDTLVKLNGWDMDKKNHEISGRIFTSSTLIDIFYYAMDNNITNLSLRTDDGLKIYTLERQYPVKKIPDTVFSYGFTPLFSYMATTAIRQGNYTEYKVRKLPKEIRN